VVPTPIVTCGLNFLPAEAVTKLATYSIKNGWMSRPSSVLTNAAAVPDFSVNGTTAPIIFCCRRSKRPYASFGNSTGDREMLEWAGRLKMLVYHDDADQEYAYGPAGGLKDSKVGTFSPALMDEAKCRAWTVKSMKNDWKSIFSFE
jgi:hypothetical protein